ncbi:MAG: hypothetical protein QM739_15125 [Propionivibrio sp.]
MGILDWFKNRPGQFNLDQGSDEAVRWGIDKAITLTNPRLKLIPGCEKRLAPAVENTISYLRTQATALPAVHTLSARTWSSDPALRAFFVAPTDIPQMLGRSENLRTLFDKFPDLDEACVVLGMAFKEQRVFGMALHGDVVQRDVAQESVSFSDHRARICGRDESRLRRLIGAEVFEYLVAHALSEIGEERSERRELQENRALIRARLRLLQQHGPGLGSMFGEAPAAKGEQERLAAELIENEKQLEAMGGSDSILEAEFECLLEVLNHPQRRLRFEQKKLKLDSMNVVLDESAAEATSVNFSVAEVRSAPPISRAFVLTRVARSELPPPQTINFSDAARLL